MRAALAEAVQASEQNEVPIGAVVVQSDRIIGRGFNQREMLNDPTAHAEMIAITSAAAYVGNWRLEGCEMFVTLEPCTMCAGALVLSRVKRLVFGASDPKAGACVSLYHIPTDDRLNHQIEIADPVFAGECGALLSEFFQRQRSLGKK